jgi:hypothetical protein
VPLGEGGRCPVFRPRADAAGPAAYAVPVSGPGLAAAPPGGIVKVDDLTGQKPHIGYIYRVEGNLYGQRVVYIGSARSIKNRLVRNRSGHDWRMLLRQHSTEVHAMKVYGHLDIAASHRQTPRSARQEALRSVEERALQEAKQEIEEKNSERKKGQKRARIGNKIRASRTPELWKHRHNVSPDKKWTEIKGPGTGFRFGAMAMGGGFVLLDLYKMYCEQKKSRYIMAPYVLADDRGAFTMYSHAGPLDGMFSTRYFKRYIAGDYDVRDIEVSESEWQILREEAEALWGMASAHGDFVPGLLLPEPPVVTPLRGYAHAGPIP